MSGALNIINTINMNGNKITTDYTPANPADATNNKHVDDTKTGIRITVQTISATYLPLAGGAMTGTIEMGTHKINSSAVPVDPVHVKKPYADYNSTGVTKLLKTMLDFFQICTRW
ncbi:hypothetical protein CHS0354_022882 [Potamilus streckersoni]|uniref:Uncharacterized protein n=1 Tax=Potamilus streckersoni TaxID=2493646 RepID=A0AAE0S1U7_9BIVA|nr:hypothetical protein CHS0354_022882 [Potamilus streckersoni]